MFRSKIIPAAIATVIAVGGASAVLASSESRGDNERQEMTAAINAKTSLAQAIAAAEKETGGKAIDAEFEDHNGVMAYKVKVSSGGKLQKVLVDPDTGKVTQTMAAKSDDHSGREHEDEDHDND